MCPSLGQWLYILYTSWQHGAIYTHCAALKCFGFFFFFGRTERENWSQSLYSRDLKMNNIPETARTPHWGSVSLKYKTWPCYRSVFTGRRDSSWKVFVCFMRLDSQVQICQSHHQLDPFIFHEIITIQCINHKEKNTGGDNKINWTRKNNRNIIP